MAVSIYILRWENPPLGLNINIAICTAPTVADIGHSVRLARIWTPTYRMEIYANTAHIFYQTQVVLLVRTRGSGDCKLNIPPPLPHPPKVTWCQAMSLSWGPWLRIGGWAVKALSILTVDRLVQSTVLHVKYYLMCEIDWAIIFTVCNVVVFSKQFFYITFFCIIQYVVDKSKNIQEMNMSLFKMLGYCIFTIRESHNFDSAR